MAAFCHVRFSVIAVVICHVFAAHLADPDFDRLTSQDLPSSNLNPATRRFVGRSGSLVNSPLDLVDPDPVSIVGSFAASLDHGSGHISQMDTSTFEPATTDTISSWESTTGKCGNQPFMAAPHQPFRVVWNHPDTCEGRHVPLHLDKYGFVFNKNRAFIGNEIQTLYSTGPWPAIHGNRTVNGGIPQLFNMDDMTSTRQAFNEHRVNNFTGLGVIDFESWRFLFYHNFGALSPYKYYSIQLVRQQHPEYNNSMVEHTAVEEWQTAARKLLSLKLAVAQEVMPTGHWGYYGYPRTWAGGPSGTAHTNDLMRWLWEKATGLYPSIYLTSPSQLPASKRNRVWAEVAEAVRIQNTISPPNTEIYPYSNIQQSKVFFQRDHLEITLGLPAAMGASGIVLWGSSSYYGDPQQCQRMQAHIRDVLGPYVKELTSNMTDCSKELCGGHGRCVHNKYDTLLNETRSVELSNQCRKEGSRFHDYHCRCYAFWSGACCSDLNTSELAACQQAAAIGGLDHVTGNHEHLTTHETGVLIGR